VKRGWEVRQLSEVCRLSIGRTPARATPAYWDPARKTSNVWVSIADLTRSDEGIVDDSREYLSDAGASLFPSVPAGTLLLSFKLSLGKVAFAGRALRTNEAIASLQVDPGSPVLDRYLYWFLHGVDWASVRGADAKIKGVTLNKATLSALPVRFPVDLAEQERMVRVLDDALDGIVITQANTEANLSNALAIFDAELSRSLAIPDGSWVARTLGEVAVDFGRGRSRHRPRNDPALYDGAYPFVQTGDVRNADRVITSYSVTYNEKGLAQSKLWPEGTLCITIAANIAESAILGFDACFPDSVVGLVPDSGLATAEFLEYLITFHRKVLQAQGKGSAQDNINLATFEAARFAMPHVHEQAAIARHLDDVSRDVADLRRVLNERARALDALRHSILDRAFSGAP